MPRTGITYEEVVFVANQIHAQGLNPTIEKIRHELGSGSHSTIAKHLQAWRQQMSVVQEPGRQSPPDIVKLAAEHAWQEISKQAEAEIAQIKADTASQLEQAALQVKVALEAEHKASIALTELQTALNKEASAKELLSLDLRTLQQTHALLEERCQGLETRIHEMQQQHLTHLSDLTQAQEQTSQQLHARFEEQKAAHLKQIEDLKITHDEDRQRAMLLLDSVREENKKLIKQHESLTKVQQSLKDNLQQKDCQLAAAEARLDTHLKESAATLAHLAKQTKQLEALQHKAWVSDEVLTKINQWPQADLLITVLQTRFDEGVHSLAAHLNRIHDAVETVKSITEEVKEHD